MISAIRQQLTPLWQALHLPHPSVKEAEARRKIIFLSRLLSWLVLINLIAIPLMVTATTLLTDLGIAIVSASTVLLTITFLINRTPYYSVAPYLLIGITLSAIFGVFLSYPYSIPDRSLNFLVLVVFVASRLFGSRGLIHVILMVLGGILLMPLMSQTPYNFHTVFWFNSMASVSLLVITVSRENEQQKLINSEQNRREVELRYQSLFQHVGEAVFILGLEGKNLDINEQGLRVLGLTREEFLSRHAQDHIAPEDRAKMHDTLRRMIAGEQFPVYERKYVHKNGSIRIGEVLAMLVKDSDGKPLYIQSIVRDVTERRQEEQKRLELAIQNERATLLNQLINEFSHYVRTPLANVKNSSYLIGRWVNSPDKINRHVEIIDEEVARMSELLDEMLTLARLETPTATEQPDYLSLNRLLSDLLPPPNGSGKPDPEHEWDFEKCPTNPHIFAHRTLLMDAFTRLFDNARLYTPINGKIYIRTQAQENVVQVAISDSGIGISKNDLPHIFENFYRSDMAREIDPLGSGMGLPITRRIIELHRGVIDVESFSGVGTAFYIYFPLDRTTRLTLDSVPTFSKLPFMPSTGIFDFL